MHKYVSISGREMLRDMQFVISVLLRITQTHQVYKYTYDFSSLEDYKNSSGIYIYIFIFI